MDELRASGVRAGLFRPLTLYPFPRAELARVSKGRHLIVVELSSGQFREDVIFQLASELGTVPTVHLVNRMGGVLIPVEEVVETARKLL